MTESRKPLETLRRDGLTGFSRKAAVYLSRRIGWRAESLSKQLDYTVAERAMMREAHALLARNEVFRDCHKGRRAFIIGNGPSINTQDLSLLRDELTFVSNAFCKHPVLDVWQPDYYFLTDPIFFDGSEYARDFFHELRGRIQSSTYFVPHTAAAVVTKDALLKSDETFHVAMAGNLADDLSWTPDFTRVVPGVRTVVQLAMMAAMFMGCTEIYLLGMDHDWLSHAGAHTAFYQGAALANESTIDDWKYKDLMEAVLIMWRGYESIKRVADAHNVRIINATRGGFLDVFERAEYESVVQ
jgi:hypothetical protein